jgi:hypothetical protein
MPDLVIWRYTYTTLVLDTHSVVSSRNRSHNAPDDANRACHGAHCVGYRRMEGFSAHVAPQQQQKVATKSHQVTPTESLNLVRNLLSTGLSCITYLRCAGYGISLRLSY